MELDKVIKSLKNVKKFSNKKPDWRDIIECIDCSRYCVMAGNNYSLKFILVDDKNIIQKIADCSQQPFIADVSYLIVVCSDLTRIINLYKQSGEIYCRQQSGAAIENILLKLNEKGLSTYWVRYFVEEIVKKELKIPDKINVEAILPIGYESKAVGEKQKLKNPIELDRILYFNKYKNKKMVNPKKLDV